MLPTLLSYWITWCKQALINEWIIDLIDIIVCGCVTADRPGQTPSWPDRAHSGLAPPWRQDLRRLLPLSSRRGNKDCPYKSGLRCDGPCVGSRWCDVLRVTLVQGFGSAFFCGSWSGQKSSCGSGSGSWGYPGRGLGVKGKNEFFLSFFHVSDDS